MQDRKEKHVRKDRRKRGFERASSLVAGRVRSAGESRGFAVSRLLTHWDDIVGADLAPIARPVEVSYGRGFGATLTLLVKGAEAPLVEMQKEKIRERVNACYGYAAIQRLRLTQTSAAGFAEEQTPFRRPTERPARAPSKAAQEQARETATNVDDPSLREALEQLGAHVLSQTKPNKR